MGCASGETSTKDNIPSVSPSPHPLGQLCGIVHPLRVGDRQGGTNSYPYSWGWANSVRQALPEEWRSWSAQSSCLCIHQTLLLPSEQAAPCISAEAIVRMDSIFAEGEWGGGGSSLVSHNSWLGDTNTMFHAEWHNISCYQLSFQCSHSLLYLGWSLWAGLQQQCTRHLPVTKMQAQQGVDEDAQLRSCPRPWKPTTRTLSIRKQGDSSALNWTLLCWGWIWPFHDPSHNKYEHIQRKKTKLQCKHQVQGMASRLGWLRAERISWVKRSREG